MSKEVNEELFEDVSTRTISNQRKVAFNLVYKGIEIEGTFTEHFDDMYSDWDREVVIETEELSDEDYDAVVEYITWKIK
jgi:hypothetical protein